VSRERLCGGGGEVRHLASRSASAANDIRKLIDASASKVQSAPIRFTPQAARWMTLLSR
jgi:hypothetical protein